MSRAAPAPRDPGYVLAPGYEVVSHLSRGDALDVYEVWSDERLCDCVAKTIRPDRCHEPRVRRRLFNEGRLLRTLSHPHLVRAYELISVPDPIVILETLPGATLEHLIETLPRRLSPSDLANLGTYLCSATHYLHGKGYLHLDLKPANVIASFGTAKLIDLSLARPPGRVPSGLGTREYLAPEQAVGGQVTAATDVWGIGVTLYEAATGLAPFRGHDGYLQLAGPPPPLRTRRRGLSPTFTETIDACLVSDPAGRPSVTELLDAFNAIMAKAASELPRPAA